MESDARAGGATLICKDCPDAATWKNGLCPRCHAARALTRRTKYKFTPEIDEQLRQAYRMRRSRPDFTRMLRDLGVLTGYPKHAFFNRAVALKINRFYGKTDRHLWTQKDIEFLVENAGRLSLRSLSIKLKTTQNAVSHKIYRLGMCRAMREGYTRKQLADLFGVRFEKVQEWTRLGWLRLTSDWRISDEEVEKFVLRRMDEYQFSRCDEIWLKEMLQGAIETAMSEQRDVAA